MAQLAGALHAIALTHMNDGIHSIARPFPPRDWMVSCPRTPGSGSDTHNNRGKWERIMTSVFIMPTMSGELKMSPRDSSAGPRVQRQSVMRLELDMTTPWPLRL